MRTLRAEVETIKRRLNALRKSGVGDEPTQRSTSVPRILAERGIIQRLRLADPTEVSSDTLWATVQPLGVKSRSTLRSYLRRMAERGVIVRTAHGRWKLAPSTPRVPLFSAEIMREIEAVATAMDPS
jgi:hypothetical protein